MADDRVRYGIGDLSSDQMRAELAEFFATAATDPGAQKEAAEADVDLDQLLAGGPGQIEIEGLDPQFTGVETALLVMLLTPPVQTAWDDVVLPWLERRHEKAVGPTEKADHEDPDD